MDDTDFYEPDEPVEDVIRAFEQGEKGLTGHVTWSDTSFLPLPLWVGRLPENPSANKSTTELPAA